MKWDVEVIGLKALDGGGDLAVVEQDQAKYHTLSLFARGQRPLEHLFASVVERWCRHLEFSWSFCCDLETVL